MSVHFRIIINNHYIFRISKSSFAIYRKKLGLLGAAIKKLNLTLCVEKVLLFSTRWYLVSTRKYHKLPTQLNNRRMIIPFSFENINANHRQIY